MNYVMFNNLSFAQLDVSFLVKETIELQSYPGSEIRGCLGWALRNVAYGTTEFCINCPNRPQCRYEDLYAYLFETPSDHPLIARNVQLQKYTQKAYPQPIVIYPPVGGVHLKEDTLTIKITVIGLALNFLPFLCCGLRLMKDQKLSGGSGKIELHGIRDCLQEMEVSKTNQLQKSGVDRWLPTILDFKYFLDQAFKYRNIRALKINFLTPFRFRHRNRMGKELNFYLFIKNLLRRITLLSVHSPLDIEINHAELLEKAKSIDVVSSGMMEWYDWERYSNKQKKRMRLGGLVGEIEFSGDLEIFMPYIKICEYLHIGKGGSFGLGKFITTNID